MLSIVLAASIFSGDISVDSSGVVRETSPFFISEANGSSAKVVALKTHSKAALQAACRRALTLPLREQVRADLMARTSQVLPKPLSFIDANITEYQQEETRDGLNCEGKVSSSDASYNIAGLALTGAWWAAEDGDIELLRAMLKVALQHRRTQADAVALIASQTDLASALAYLDEHLHPEKLTLNQSKIAVGKIWLAAEKFDEVVNLMGACDEPVCLQLLENAEDKLQQIEASQADDLSSYF